MSQACERFVLDICSANPNICKTCKNNKTSHTSTAPIKRDSQPFAFKNTIPQQPIKQTIQPPPQIQSKIEPTKSTTIEVQVEKVNIIKEQPISAGAKSAEVKPIVVNERIEIEQKQQQQNTPTQNSQKSSVAQMIKEREEKLKQQQQSNINSYSSTPRRDTIQTQSHRSSVASATHSQQSNQTPKSQNSQPIGSFSTFAQNLKDKSQINDVNPKDTEIQITIDNTEKEGDITKIKVDSLQNELEEESQSQQLAKNQQLEKEKLLKQQQEKEDQLKQAKEKEEKDAKERDEKLAKEREEKLAKEREEKQLQEKEALAKSLRQQNEVQKEEKPKINSTKGLTFAEILARQKQKADTGNVIEINKPTPISVNNYSTQQPPNSFNNYNKLQQPQQNNLSGILPPPPKPLTSLAPPQIHVQKKEEPKQIPQVITKPQEPSSEIKTKTEVPAQLPSQPIVKEQEKVIQTIEQPKPIQKEEQKPLGLVALRKLEFQNKMNQAQQQTSQYNSVTPKSVKLEDIKKKEIDAPKLNKPIIQNETQQKVIVPPTLLSQPKVEITPQINQLPKQEEVQKQNETSNKLNKKDDDENNNNNEGKKVSLVSQLKSQLGKQLISFGLPQQPQVTQKKVVIDESTESKETQNKQFENLPFLKEEKSDRDSQRDSIQDVLERPVMKKNVRSSRKINFDDIKEDDDD